MELYAMNQQFETIAYVDTFESLIWHDRYNTVSEFELYGAPSELLLTTVADDSYLWLEGSEKTMIVESHQITTDAEAGSHVIIKGRSLESLLDRRIVWGKATYSGSVHDAIRQILNEAIISSPQSPIRNIPGFVFQNSSDSRVTAPTTMAQYTGDNVYNVVQKLCEDNDIGFKVILNASNQFVFSLFAGTDRSYNQTANPYVVFSPNFDNLLNSDYVKSKELYKTVALVGGEGEDDARTYLVVDAGENTGLGRRELFVDANDVQRKNGAITYTEPQYQELLRTRGREKLADLGYNGLFGGNLDPNGNFMYGRDFFLGDIVQVANEYNLENSTRVTEILYSQDKDGVTIVPTFKAIGG